MQDVKRVAILFTILPLLIFTACRQETDIRLNDDVAAVQQPDLESFRSDVQAELQRIDQELNQLEQELAVAMEDEVDDLRDRTNDLRQERMEIEQDLQQLAVTTDRDWEDSRRNLQRRVDELAVDVSRARLDAATTIDEFRNLAQSELNQIDRKMSELEQRHQMVMRDHPDRDVMAEDDRTTVDRDPADGIGITGEGRGLTMPGDLAGGIDTEIENLREERQQISEDLDELAAVTEDEFDQRKDQLSDAIADLNSDVRTAMLKLDEQYDFARTESETRPDLDMDTQY